MGTHSGHERNGESARGGALQRLERRLAAAWAEQDAYQIEQLAGMIYDRLVRSDPSAAATVLEQNAHRLAVAGKPAEAAELATRLIRHWRELEQRPFYLTRLQQMVLEPLQALSGVEAARARTMVLEAVLAWKRASATVDTEEAAPAELAPVQDALVDAYVLCGEWARAQYQVVCRGGPAERDLAFIDEQLGPHLANDVERMLARTRLVLFYVLAGNLKAGRALVEEIQRKHPTAPMTNFVVILMQVLERARNVDSSKRRLLRNFCDDLKRVYHWAFSLDPELDVMLDDALKAQSL
jgi:hypothetical protein